MSHLITIGDKRIVNGRVTIPLYGTWSADFRLAEANKISGATSFVMGDLSMQCFARPARTGIYAGKSACRVVGGAGGLNKVIPPKGYSHSAGVKLATILKDAASAAGEKINITGNKGIGPVWARKQCRASSVLRLLLDDKWWMDETGTIQTKDRTSTKIVKPFQVIDYKPELGQIEIGTESFKDWMPGRTFEYPTLPASQTISSVSFVIADGKIRTIVTNTETKEQRLIQDIRAIVRDEVFRMEYGEIVEYTITESEEMKISGKPTEGKTSKWPPLSDVKLKAGLMGEKVTPTVGAKCLILFVNSDPSMYRCIAIEDISQKTTFGASGNIEITSGATFKVVASSVVDLVGTTQFKAAGGSGKLELTSALAKLDAALIDLGVGGSGVVTQLSLAPVMTAFVAYLTAEQAFLNGPIAALSGGLAAPAAAAAAALSALLIAPHYSLTVKAKS